MKFLVFRYTEDDRGNELLEEIEVDEDFADEDEVLTWLPTLKDHYVGTRYLIVATFSWTQATTHKKPITTVATADGWDDATLLRREKEYHKVSRAVGLMQGLPADAKKMKGTT